MDKAMYFVEKGRAYEVVGFRAFKRGELIIFIDEDDGGRPYAAVAEDDAPDGQGSFILRRMSERMACFPLVSPGRGWDGVLPLRDGVEGELFGEQVQRT